MNNLAILISSNWFDHYGDNLLNETKINYFTDLKKKKKMYTMSKKGV